MNGSKPSSAFRNVILGYAGLLLSIAKILGFLAVLFTVSAALTYPLWYLATEHVEIYTLSTAVLLAAVLLFIIVKRISAAYRRERKVLPFLRNSILPPLAAAAKAAVILAASYLLIILFLNERTAIAVALTPFFLAGTGFLLYGKKHRKDWNG